MARTRNDDTTGDEVVTPDTAVAAPADERVLPSDIEGLARQYNLTMDEAERLARESGKLGDDSVADRIKGERRIYRVRYESVAAHANALTAADTTAAVNEKRAAKADETRESLVAAATTPTIDSTKPESGPHGPFASYENVEVKPEEVATQTPDLTVEEAREVMK